MTIILQDENGDISETFYPDGSADIIRKSPFSGKENIMNLTLSFDQFDAWREGGELIQNAMPHLSADEREFIMTGITSAEWDAAFKKKPDHQDLWERYSIHFSWTDTEWNESTHEWDYVPRYPISICNKWEMDAILEVAQRLGGDIELNAINLMAERIGKPAPRGPCLFEELPS